MKTDRIASFAAIVAALVSVLSADALASAPSRAHSATLSVEGYTGTTALQGFPVLVRLSESRIGGFSGAQCAANGADLVFTSPDGETVYPHEVDTWNASGESTVWVRLPVLNAGTTFKVWWGGSASASTAADVWANAQDGFYIGVWHLNGDVGDDEPDSAKRDAGLDMTAVVAGRAAAAPSQMYSTSSQTGRARHLNDVFTAGGNYLKAPSPSSLYSDRQYSVSFWMDPVTVSKSTWGYCIACHQGEDYQAGWCVYDLLQANDKHAFYAQNGANKMSTSTLAPGSEWIHVVFTCNDTDLCIYMNGILAGAATTKTRGFMPDYPILFGITKETDASVGFGGSMDEVRIAGGVVFSADWVKAEYDTVANELFITEAKTKWTATTGGRFDDGANWSTGSAPAAGAPAVFADDATYSVTFPEAYSRDNALAVTKASGMTTFDTTGGSWTLPAASTYLGAQEHPVIFKTAAGNVLVVDQGETATGILKSENGAFSFAGGAAPKVTFASGLINFYDPDGTAPTVLNTLRLNADVDAETEFAGGLSRLPNLPINPAATRTVDRIAFTGGTNEIFGLVTVTNRMPLHTASVLEVSGAGTSVDMKGGYDGLGSGDGEGNYASFHSDVLTVTNGATLTVGGTRFRTYAADFLLEVASGATLNVNSEFFSLGTIYDTSTTEQLIVRNCNTNRVLISDATVNFGPTVRRAWFSSYDKNEYGKSYTTLSATNSEINSAVDLVLHCGVYGFKDCTGDIRGIVGEYRRADLTIDGGALNVTNAISMNNISADNLTNSVAFKAGDHTVRQITVSQNNRASAAGVLAVSGGTLTVTDLLCFSTAGATSVFDLTGGLVDVTGTTKAFSSTSGSCFMNLTGGTLRMKTLSIPENKNVKLWFHADGGTVEAGADDTDLLPNYVSYDYRLGAKGLVIWTDCHETRSTALFKNADDEEGLLVKDGSGTLVLGGTAFDFSKMEVRGGTLRFPAAATGLAFPPTTVAGGAIDLSGTNGKPAIESLTLGDGTSVGELKVDNASVCQLDDFTPLNAKITLTDPATDGTYDAFAVKGDQTSKLALWQKTVADLPAGKRHVYTAAYDADNDVTTFSITVENQPPPSGTAHWTGAASAAWETDANWTDAAKAPTKVTTAIFESGDETNVEIGSAAAAAGLSFDAAPGYSIGGSGSLTLSEDVAGGIAVASGDHTVDVPLVLKSMLPMTVAEGASLTLAKEVTQDGIIKRGAGLLVLNGENDLRYGIQVEAGTMVAGQAAAFVDKPLVFKGASRFSYADVAAAESAEPLRLDTGAAGTSVEIDTTGNLVFDGCVNAGGSLVKSGAGALTVNFNKDSRLFAKNETLTVNDGTLRIDIPSGVATDQKGDGQGVYVVSNGTLAVTGSGVFREKSASVNLYPPSEQVGAVPKLAVTGTTFETGTLRVGNTASVREEGQSAAVFFTNATVNVRGNLIFSGTSNLTTRLVAKDSTVKEQNLYPQDGWFSLDFDNSKLECTAFFFCDNTRMDALFTHGAAFSVPAITYNGKRDAAKFGGMTLQFDDGVINYGNNAEYCLCGDMNKIESLGGGVTIQVAANKTIGFSQPIEGVGGIVKTGAGVLAFRSASFRTLANPSVTQAFDSPVTLACLGKTEVREGTLQVTSGVVRTGAEAFFSAGTTLDLQDSEVAFGAVAGSPTVVNGTLAAAKLVVSNGDSMVFGDAGRIRNAAFRLVYAYSPADLAAQAAIESRIAFGSNPPTGVRVVVDLGNGEGSDSPLVVLPGASVTGVIATYTGADPDVSRWRVKGRGGRGASGFVTAADGEIRLTLTPANGLSILVR